VTGSSPYAGHTASGRLLLWSETVRLIAGHPLLGAGPGGYIDAIPAYHDARYERRVGPQTPPDSPHDWLLQAAAAGGLPLLVLVLALAGLTVVCGRRAVRRQPGGGEAAAVAGMLAGVAGYGVALLFFFTTPGSTPLAALLGGALLATESPPAAVAARLTRAAVAAALAALTLLLAAAAVAEIPLRDAIDAAARLRLPASDRDFGIARDLRPWDPAVDAAAAHAFAVLAGEGVAGAACDGLPWARRELAATPDSIEGLGDGAELDLSAGRFSTSVALLARARRDDPANPLLAAQARLAEQDLATGPAGGRRRAGCPGAV
jgi:O-antigen ligase